MRLRAKLDNMAVGATSRATLLRSAWTLSAMAAFLLAPLPARSQSNSQSTPSSSDSTQKSSSPPAKKPSTAEQFPYPGDPQPSNSSSSPSQTTPSDTNTPDAPSSSTPPSAPTDTTRKFPYPGDSSTPAPTAPNPTAKQFPYPGESPAPSANGNSSSSSSSDDSGSSSNSGSDPNPDPDPDSKLPPPPTAKNTGRRKLEKVRDLQTPDEREAEDIKVGKFYQDKGDWNAAYFRYKDAVKTQADDPDAHFYLAEVALKLNKRDEAIAEYKTTLTLDASDKQIKAAKKALADLH
jgi:hypothetical protein